MTSGQNKLQGGAAVKIDNSIERHQAVGRDKTIGPNMNFHRAFHPPPRPFDGGEPPDPPARSTGADEPSGAAISRGRRDHDHDHDRVYGRERGTDAGLHQRSDRESRVECGGRRLRHVAEPPGPQHRVGAHAPQHRTERSADRGDREGAAGPREAAERCGGSGRRQGHGPDLRLDVSDLRELGDEPRAGDGVSDPRRAAPIRDARGRGNGRDPRRPRLLDADLDRSRFALRRAT